MNIKDTSFLGRIDAILEDINTEKRASEMPGTGSGKTDPGGYDGPTSHPSGKVDGNLGPTPMGARLKENEKDVKEQYAQGVDNTTPGSGGTQDDKQHNIGLHVSATGEDPKVEDNYRGNYPDPGTSHPADVEEIGEKYASLRDDVLLKTASTKINAVLAAIVNGNEVSTKSAANNRPQQQTPQPAPQTAPQQKPQEAAAFGSAVSEALLGGFDKQAVARAVIEQTILEATRDADNVARYYYDRLKKSAEAPPPGGMPPEAMMGGGGMPPGMEGGMPPEAAMGGGMGGMPPEGGAGGPPGEDPAAALAGAAGPGAESGPGGEGGLGDGDGDEGHVAALGELVNALEEVGIPPEQLLAAAQGAGNSKMAALYDATTRKIASALSRNPEAAALLGNHAHDILSRTANGHKFPIQKAANKRQFDEREMLKSYLREACGVR